MVGGGPADRLGGVVDEDVEVGEAPVDGLQQAGHGRQVEQVDTVDVDPVRPVRGVGDGREPAGRVPREAGRDQHLRAVAQQLQRQLETDLHPAAGHDRPAAAQVASGVPASEVLLGAFRAEQVVLPMHLPVGGLADVAAPRPLSIRPASPEPIDGSGSDAPAGSGGPSRPPAVRVPGRDPAPGSAPSPPRPRGRDAFDRRAGPPCAPSCPPDAPGPRPRAPPPTGGRPDPPRGPGP